MQLRELTELEFNEFVNQFPNFSIYQTKEYGSIMNQEKCTSVYVGLIKESRIVAASLLIIRKINGFKYASAPRGFLIDYTNFQLLSEFTKQLKKYLKNQDVVAIKISPMVLRKKMDKEGNILYSNPDFDKIFEYLKKLEYYHFGFNNYFEGDKPRYEANINLKDRNVNDLFNSVDKKYRTKIRSSLKKGVKIYKGTEEHVNYIYEHSKNKYLRNPKFYNNTYNEFNESGKVDFFYAKLDTKNYLEYCRNSFEQQDEVMIKLNDELMNGKKINKSDLINRKMIEDNRLESTKKELVSATELLKNSPGGVPVASIITIKHKKDAFVMMDGFDQKLKHINAKHLLLWSLIARYSEEGYENFNLGGIPGIKTNNPKYNGLKEFKFNFEPYINEYIGDLELITNNTLYFAFKQAKAISKIFDKKDNI